MREQYRIAAQRKRRGQRLQYQVIQGRFEKRKPVVPNLSSFRYLLISGKESDHERKKKIVRNKL